jgi:hypothetical protein
MDRDRWLAAVSAAQLGAGLAGLAVALKRRHPYDFLFLHGRPENIACDAVVMGTAFSAPYGMLAAQAVATVQLLRGSSQPARLVLGALGAAMVPGYLGEAHVRRRLRLSSFDPLESSLVLMGITLAAAVAALALAPRRSE